MIILQSSAPVSDQPVVIVTVGDNLFFKFFFFFSLAIFQYNTIHRLTVNDPKLLHTLSFNECKIERNLFLCDGLGKIKC